MMCHFRFEQILVASLMVMLLAGCGQKGSLYLPDQKPPVSSSAKNSPLED